jgi:hypothetical protein
MSQITPQWVNLTQMQPTHSLRLVQTQSQERSTWVHAKYWWLCAMSFDGARSNLSNVLQPGDHSSYTKWTSRCPQQRRPNKRQYRPPLLVLWRLSTRISMRAQYPLRYYLMLIGLDVILIVGVHGRWLRFRRATWSFQKWIRHLPSQQAGLFYWLLYVPLSCVAWLARLFGKSAHSSNVKDLVRM